MSAVVIVSTILKHVPLIFISNQPKNKILLWQRRDVLLKCRWLLLHQRLRRLVLKVSNPQLMITMSWFRLLPHPPLLPSHAQSPCPTFPVWMFDTDVNDTVSASILLQPLSYLRAHILHSCSHFTQLCSTHTTYYIFNKDRFAICTIYTSCLVSIAIPLLLYSCIISVFTNVYSILYHVWTSKIPTHKR